MQNDKKEAKSKGNESDEEIKLEKPSYTYWKRDADKAADHAGFQPQQVQGKVEQTNNQKVGSAWNSAGTWEEKKLNKEQVTSFLNEHIEKNPIIYKEAVKLHKFSGYSGDTYFVFSRGKIKFIYDCEIKVNVKGQKECEGADTDVTVKEMSNADPDDDFEYEFESVTKSGNEKKYQLVQIFKACTKDFQNDIKKMFNLLKEHHLQ